MLTDEQKRTFKREGYLVLEEGIDSELIEQGHELIGGGIPYDLDDEEALLEAEDHNAWGDWVEAEEPFQTINDQLYEYGRDLVGDALVAPDSPSQQLSLRFPQDIRLSDYHLRRPTGEYVDGPHLDGFGGSMSNRGEYGGHTLGCVVYYGDVTPRGGGFTVLPRSHWVAAEFFKDNHPHSAGGAGWLPAIHDDPETSNWHGGWDLWGKFWEQARSRSIAGDAGTVILWHNKMVHCSGVNQSSNVRMAGITRLNRHDLDDIRYDAADKPFKYWDLDEIEVEIGE